MCCYGGGLAVVGSEPMLCTALCCSVTCYEGVREGGGVQEQCAAGVGLAFAGGAGLKCEGGGGVDRQRTAWKLMGC